MLAQQKYSKWYLNQLFNTLRIRLNKLDRIKSKNITFSSKMHSIKYQSRENLGFTHRLSCEDPAIVF